MKRFIEVYRQLRRQGLSRDQAYRRAKNYSIRMDMLLKREL